MSQPNTERDTHCLVLPEDFPPVEVPKPLPKWQSENLYNTRVLLKNWFEDRRQYEQNCSRCTGHSITRTDYLPYTTEDYIKCRPTIGVPSAVQEGEGWNLFRNTEDYCDYLQNYTTTYDLMHNWDVRRCGVKPKPLRNWKPIYDSTWVPDQDNAVALGNLTQIHYRQAPQLPLVPNDWELYSNVKTEYQERYFPPRFPDAYTLCRYAPPKHLTRETEDMSLMKNPFIVCDKCGTERPCDNDADCCGCYRRNAPRFHETLVPGHTLRKNIEPHQTLFPSDAKFPYKIAKRKPHEKPVPGYPMLDTVRLVSDPVPCYSRE